jgi:hypothetical protein
MAAKIYRTYCTPFPSDQGIVFCHRLHRQPSRKEFSDLVATFPMQPSTNPEWLA